MSCFQDLIKRLCPPKQDNNGLLQCANDLARCQDDKAALERQLGEESAAYLAMREERDVAKMLLTNCNENVAALQKQYNEVLAIYELITKGPIAPSKANLRLLSAVNMQQLLAVRIGQPFLDCLNRGGVHFAWPPWLIPKMDDVLRYLDFYNRNILPLIQPYTVLDWVDTKGVHHQVSGRTCSDFSAFFWGLPTLYLGWTPLAWAIMWAYVQSLFLTGGHAFDFLPTWAPPFSEDDGIIDGLSLLEIEPQTSGRWTAGGVAIDATARVESMVLKPVTPERFSGIAVGYQIDAVYNIAA